jgi:8-oxo-dGTP pyrophosphatase MutT (NUDIX family)
MNEGSGSECWEHVEREGSDEDRRLPPYCCVILLRNTTAGEPAELFVEQRPAKARVEAGRLTCFGGKREAKENPLDAIKRECLEELSWVPSDLVRACDLFVDGKLVAWFYLAAAPPPGTPLRFEPGVEGMWITAAGNDKRLSPWHRAVLSAWHRGEQRVAVVSPS